MKKERKNQRKMLVGIECPWGEGPESNKEKTLETSILLEATSATPALETGGE